MLTGELPLSRAMVAFTSTNARSRIEGMSRAENSNRGVKDLLRGTALEGPARELLGRWRSMREPYRTLDSIRRYTNPVPRYGHGHPPNQRLYDIIDAGRPRYTSLVEQFDELREDYLKIPIHQGSDISQPHWDNGWIPRLDGIALYCMLATTNPALYLEVGSGVSTKFARRAIRDHDLQTRIVSIDPHPRAECDQLCDEVIRGRLETIEVSALLNRISPGDIMFLDGSHRSFMNSDATVFFLEILPELPLETLVHVHDIYLPADYPPQWAHRYYTEQYLMATWLLGGSAGYQVHCPNYFISQDKGLNGLLDKVWGDNRMSESDPHGCSSFWIRRTDVRGTP
jgi:Methyltransferase domain